MHFPDSPRVIYSSNPLDAVVCQLRFPKILSLEDRVPSDFQEAISNDYPLVQIKNVTHFELPTAMLGDGVRLPIAYEFSSFDQNVTVTLTSEAVSVQTKSYVQWEQFSEAINKVAVALVNAYPIPFFTRVGLRYINFIDRNQLGLKRVPWSALIRKSILGVINEKQITDLVECQTAVQVIIDSGHLVCRYGLGKHPDGRPGFAIDNDFFATKQVAGADDAIKLLGEFNRSSGQCFRWFISDRLHNALVPSAVP